MTSQWSEQVKVTILTRRETDTTEAGVSLGESVSVYKYPGCLRAQEVTHHKYTESI